MEIFRLLKGRPLRIMELLGASWRVGGVSVVAPVEMDVTTITVKLRWSSQSSVSQDLKKLRRAGLVGREQRGLHVFYKLSENFSETLNNLGSPEVAMEKYRALNKGKNRQLVVKFLTDNPGSALRGICPGLNRHTVSYELSVLRKARVLEFTVENKRKIYSLKSR